MKLTAKQSIDMLQGDALRSLYYAFPVISLIYYSILGKSPLVTRNGNKSIALNSGGNQQVFTGNFSYAGDKLNLSTLLLTGIDQYLGKSLLWKAEGLAIMGSQYKEFISAGDDETSARSYALKGVDIIIGSAKSDTLYGGGSSDRLTGGTGADRFFYNAVSDSRTSTSDTITDFKRSEADKIDLSKIDADPNRSGNQRLTFIGNKQFTGRAGEVRFSGGIIEVDTNWDKKSDMQIFLSGIKDFQSSSLIL